MTPSNLDLWLLVLASMGAGAVDAIVGGGGLILTPSLFGVLPQALPATLLGTNKATSIWGTGWAAWRFGRRVTLRAGMIWPATAAAFVASLLGAWTSTTFSPQTLRRALPFVLGAVLLYTLWQRDLGREHRPSRSRRTETAIACAIGATVGYYDGLFGPGAGSFFVFLLVRLLGHDFLHASAGAKRLNTATNAAALLLFGVGGHVLWRLAAVLAIANVIGSLSGTRLALRFGAGFVRWAFIVVVGLLIAKTGHDAFVAHLDGGRRPVPALPQQSRR